MNDNGNDDDTRPIEAVRALRARGIDNAEEMLTYGTADEILAACHRWDGRHNVGPGLLARWIRDREFEEPPKQEPLSKGEQLRARFDEYAARFPEGTAIETHAQLIERRWPDEYALGDVCPGDMVVIEATYPLLSMECNACGFVAALPVKALHILGAPLRLAEPPAPF